MTDQQKQLLEFARSLIGTPYKYAVPADEIPKFLDCSSFTQLVYKKIGIEIPRSTIAQARDGRDVEKGDLIAGDLILLRGTKGHYNDEWFPGRNIYIGHVAMYTENANAIHASSTRGVVEENLDEIIKATGPISVIKRII